MYTQKKTALLPAFALTVGITMVIAGFFLSPAQAQVLGGQVCTIKKNPTKQVNEISKIKQGKTPEMALSAAKKEALAKAKAHCKTLTKQTACAKGCSAGKRDSTYVESTHYVYDGGCPMMKNKTTCHAAYRTDGVCTVALSCAPAKAKPAGKKPKKVS